MAFALAAFLLIGEYTRKAHLNGVLVPIDGMARVVAPQGGRVAKLIAREGTLVEKDAPLLTLEDVRTNSAREAMASIVTSQLDLRRSALWRQREFTLAAMQAEQAALARRRSSLRREVEQIEVEIGALASRVSLASRSLGRAQRLEGLGFVSAAALDREREASLDQEARLEAMRRARMGLVRDLAAAEMESASSLARANAQLAALDVQRAAMDLERLERDAQFRGAVIAPARGVLSTLLVDDGQMVASGATLATIIPEDAALEAHLFASSRAIGFIRSGQRVMVRYAAYPHQKFGSHGARVVAISRNPLPAMELGFAGADGGREPVYRIKLELDAQAIGAYGRLEALQAGMQVEADILLDRRRLIEWIFEPLLSLAGRT